MADLEQWWPAAEGEQLLAAAPMVGEWRGPADGWTAALPAAIAAGTVRLVISFASHEAVWWVVLVSFLTLMVGALIWRRWWRKGHPLPTGMAAALDWRWGRGPVLLVTGSGVLQTGLRNASLGRAAPLGPAKDIPGLVAVDAVDERLVLRFEDGSEAALRQRSPTPGAAARVAELAAPVLRRRRLDEPAHASGPT